MPWSPVEVLAGVPAYQAAQAVALLRDAGIPVNVREQAAGNTPACWLYVARADAEQALGLLAGHWFPVSTVPAKEVVLLPQAPPAPGDDVWALLTQQDPPWPSVYSFP
jgi:hypothetical protein